MSASVRELAELVQGELCGDGALEIQAARPLEDAGAGEITFVEDARHAPLLGRSRASAAVVPSDLVPNGVTVIRVRDPLTAFISIVRHLHGRPEPTPSGVDSRASVHASASVGPDASILPFAVIGEGTVIGARCRIHPGAVVGRYCRLGDDVTLYGNVVLYDDTVLGNRVVVHTNAVIGADGFGYRQVQGRHVKVPQLGHVELGDDVEVGACTTIDRGTFKPTFVGEGTKIDNLVQVAHNCRIGRHNLLVSQAGIGGSSRTGNYVVIAGQAGVVDHADLGDGVIVGGQAGVTKSVPAGQRVLGTPAIPERDCKRVFMSFDKLPQLRRDVRRIKERLGLGEE